MPSVVVMLLAAQPIAVAPLRVEHGSRVAELRADGAIVNSAGAEIGRIENGAVRLRDFLIFLVDDEGVVRSRYAVENGRFDDDGALVFFAHGERRRCFVTDDGMFAIEGPSGRVQPTGVRVTGMTPDSRRAAVLLALTLLSIERDGMPKPPPRMRVTLDVFGAAFEGYFEIAPEVRLDRRFSLALHAGGGTRWKQARGPGTTTLAWEIGVEPRWFLSFLPGWYIGWSTRFARTRSAVSFDTMHTPPGLSTGLLLGEQVDVFGIIEVDLTMGLQFLLVTPPNESSHPLVAGVWRMGVGFTF